MWPRDGRGGPLPDPAQSYQELRRDAKRPAKSACPGETRVFQAWISRLSHQPTRCRGYCLCFRQGARVPRVSESSPPISDSLVEWKPPALPFLGRCGPPACVQQGPGRSTTVPRRPRRPFLARRQVGKGKPCRSLALFPLGVPEASTDGDRDQHGRYGSRPFA